MSAVYRTLLLSLGLAVWPSLFPSFLTCSTLPPVLYASGDRNPISPRLQERISLADENRQARGKGHFHWSSFHYVFGTSIFPGRGSVGFLLIQKCLSSCEPWQAVGACWVQRTLCGNRPTCSVSALQYFLLLSFWEQEMLVWTVRSGCPVLLPDVMQTVLSSKFCPGNVRQRQKLGNICTFLHLM